HFVVHAGVEDFRNETRADTLNLVKSRLAPGKHRRAFRLHRDDADLAVKLLAQIAAYAGDRPAGADPGHERVDAFELFDQLGAGGGVGRSGLDEGVAGLESSFALGALDHREADAVFDATAGIIVFEFGPHFGVLFAREPVEPDHRGVPDQVQGRACDAYWHGG